MKVDVTHNEFWNWPEQVTVQFGDIWDGRFYVDTCNHAGAEEETMTVTYGRFGESEERILTCDKENCGAWRFADQDEWRRKDEY